MKKIILFAFILILFSSCNEKICDLGYSGEDCDIQITPSIIKITRIDVINFPSGNYDIGSNPDIYITFSDYNGELYTSPNYFENAISGQTYTYTLTTPINITEPLEWYAIRVYDYDSADQDDFICGIDYSPYNSHNQFPQSELLSIDDISFRVYYEYEW